MENVDRSLLASISATVVWIFGGTILLILFDASILTSFAFLVWGLIVGMLGCGVATLIEEWSLIKERLTKFFK